MSVLANLLHANREAILRVFVKRVHDTPSAALAEAAGGGDRLLEVIASERAEGDPSGAAAWAEAFWRETDPNAVSYADALSGLAGLERILHFQIVRQIANKQDLLAALGPRSPIA